MIHELCMSYYDMKLLGVGKDPEQSSDLDSSLLEKLDEYSFMQNKSDDNDKVKYHWAFNLPCALLVNGKNKFWFDHIK